MTVHSIIECAVTEIAVTDIAGQIVQRQEIIELIQKSVLVADCRPLQTPNAPIEFLTAKPTSLYLVPIDGRTATFCS